MKKPEYQVFRGIMPILPTPVDERGDIDTEDIASLAEYCLSSGAAAIGHLAGASEYQYIADEDRPVIIKATVDAVAGRVPVFIGAAACSLKDTVRNALTAQELGADMIMLCSPPAGGCTQDELFGYYEKVCGAVRLPVIVQDTGNSWQCFTPNFLVRLYNEIENIGYVKAEGGAWLVKLNELMSIVPDGMQVIGGAAGKNMMQMLRLGVTAYMTGTEATDIHAAVVSAYTAGDEERALSLYCTTLLPYLEVYTSHSFHASLKHMLKRRGVVKNDLLIFPGLESGQTSQYVLGELDWILDKIEAGIPGNPMKR